MGNKQGEMNVIKNLLQALGGWLAQPESHSAPQRRGNSRLGDYLTETVTYHH
jgi:hypothetical protein